MSYISICDFIQDGRKSLEAKNYWNALSVALMLPSMCSRLAYANNPDYLWEKGKSRDKKCYVDWCRENIDKDGWIISFLGENYAEVLYDIRCDIVYAGYAQVYPDHYPDGLGFYFSIGDELSTELTKYRIINVSTLCEQLFFMQNPGVRNLAQMVLNIHEFSITKIETIDYYINVYVTMNELIIWKKSSTKKIQTT